MLVFTNSPPGVTNMFYLVCFGRSSSKILGGVVLLVPRNIPQQITGESKSLQMENPWTQSAALPCHGRSLYHWPAWIPKRTATFAPHKKDAVFFKGDSMTVILELYTLFLRGKMWHWGGWLVRVPLDFHMKSLIFACVEWYWMHFGHEKYARSRSLTF